MISQCYMAEEGLLYDTSNLDTTHINMWDRARGMTTPILTTKLSIPPMRLDGVFRPRLIKQIDQGVTRKLTLISAPAGFGKTTLIASWLHRLGDRQQDGPRVAWLSLEDDDNDPIHFFTHFIAALQTIDSGVGQTARPFLEMPRIPKLNHLMTLLINDLAMLQGQSVLVLDDYHLINYPELQAAVAFFLEHLPSHFHLIIATREEPLLPLPRLRAKWEVTEIRLQDLRFTCGETEVFLNRTMGLALTAEAAQTLEDRTEGWVAGLQMAALSLRGETRTPGSEAAAWEVDAFSGGHRYIIDYLAAEVLRLQTVEFRNFLRQTSILDRFNAALCDAVTGRDDSETMLAQLEQANLFLIPLDNERHWYRYHHLFADFLRTELTELEQLALHCEASRWHEAHGLTSEAIKHALAAHDPLAAVRLIRDNAEETLRNGGFATILGWVNALPEETVRTNNDMLVHKGWILYLKGEIATAETYAALAIENLRADAPPIQRGMLLSFRSYLAINRGDPPQAAHFAQEALELLGDTESHYRACALSHLGQAQRLMGDRETAIETLRQAIALGQRFGNHLVMLEALAYLTMLLYQQGELSEAILLCEQAASRCLDARGNPVPAAGLAYVSLGILYYEINDLSRAHHYLTTSIDLCLKMGIVHSALLGQCTLAKLYYVRGETKALWETLASARRLATRAGNDRRMRLVNVVVAGIQLREGQVDAAALTLSDLPLAADNRSEQENLIFVRLLLGQGRIKTAQSLLQQLEQSAQRDNRRGSLITIHLLQALAHRTLGHSAEALDYLEEAIFLAAPEGYRRLFIDEGPAVAELLPHRQSLAPAFVADILEAFPESPAESRSPAEMATSKKALPSQVQPLVEPLSEAQLGVLRLVADGLSNRDIAARLEITEGTTKWHLNQIYGKLNVCSRTQAVAQARQLRIL